jgi:hypothetical protein
LILYLNYHGVPFNQHVRLTLDIDRGWIEGQIGKDFKARINNSSRKAELTLDEGLFVRTTPSGTIYSKLFNEKTHRVEEYQREKL